MDEELMLAMPVMKGYADANGNEPIGARALVPASRLERNCDGPVFAPNRGAEIDDDEPTRATVVVVEAGAEVIAELAAAAEDMRTI